MALPPAVISGERSDERSTQTPIYYQGRLCSYSRLGWISLFAQHDIQEPPLKTVILAGGMGTRLTEEIDNRPVPMGGIVF